MFAILTDARVTGDGPIAAPAGITGHASRGADDHPAMAQAAGSGVLRGGSVEPGGRLAPLPAASWLRRADPQRVLLVIACSAAKARGGHVIYIVAAYIAGVAR